MPAIYQPTQGKIRILQSEKTSFPVLRRLTPGLAANAVAEGELVGVRANPGMTPMLEKITAANYVAQAVNALMRVNTTTNDVIESGAISCQQGLYLLQTQLYLASGSYAIGDFLTLRYDAVSGGGVFGPEEVGTTTHLLAKVEVAPSDASANTPMVLLVFPQPTRA